MCSTTTSRCYSSTTPLLVVIAIKLYTLKRIINDRIILELFYANSPQNECFICNANDQKTAIFHNSPKADEATRQIFTLIRNLIFNPSSNQARQDINKQKTANCWKIIIEMIGILIVTKKKERLNKRFLFYYLLFTKFYIGFD